MTPESIQALYSAKAFPHAIIQKSLNWRFAVEFKAFLPIRCPDGSTVNVQFKHPVTANELFLLRFFDDLKVPFKYEDLTSATISDNISIPKRCRICRKSSFKTPLNCFNPQRLDRNRWACNLQKGLIA
ncbi:MAG: hypothetical protein LAT55_12275 [Opitutales bacterium]|nr:hypothetical protein [Opitutales bacterium]